MTPKRERGKGKDEAADLLSRLQAVVGDAYRLEKELGGGGMSRVFLAEEVRLGRNVVIKVLPPEMAAGVNVERFEREIQLAARLQHPHVVPLLTAGASGDLLYYVMPFIKGESLRAKLAREGELPIGEAARILRDVADALAYAHGEGVVHRDIKPDNVLLSGHHAVVTDFGVAKAVSASTGASSLTSLGVALGTPAYMAPEQAVADPHVDHRADIYALGALGYEMLCGRPPFTGPNAQAVLSMHVTEAPEAVTRHRNTVPPGLNEVIMRCLAKKAADRWQKAEEVRAQFEVMVTPTGGMTPTGTQPVLAVSAAEAAAKAHPVRVAGLFGLASVGVLAIVYAAVQLIGLPDWVFYGAIGLLVVGLPIMLLTGRRERQRAMATMTGVRVTTPVGLERHFTWRKAILGGGLAFAGLAVVAGGYMAMRLLGIGPVGTLVASGVLDQRGLLIVAEFADRTPDANIAPSVTQALRVDLSQSPAVKLMDAAAIQGVLKRMGRPDTAVVDAALGREIAQREGVKAVLGGDVGVLGSGYVVTARLIGAADGAELLALRETAADAAGLIPAVDRLSKRLRGRIGESFKSIRSAEPLAQVTTASLEALRLYTRAEQLDDQGDAGQAVRVLEQAIGVDSNFAMAYRKQGVILSNTLAEQSRIKTALTKAFELRDRLPPLERLLTTAYYYSNVQNDPQQTIDAYQAVLEIDAENSTAINNQAVTLEDLRRWKEAEELFRRGIAVGAIWQNFAGLTRTLVEQGRWDAADSALAAFRNWAPGNANMYRSSVMLATAQRDFRAADSLVDRLVGAERLTALLRIGVPEVQGRLRAAARVTAQVLTEAEGRGRALDVLRLSLEPARRELRYGSPANALRELERALTRHPLSRVPAEDRPYEAMAAIYAEAKRPADVRRLRGEWASAPTVRTASERAWWDAAVAMAEGQYAEAARAYLGANEQQGFPSLYLWDAARAYDLAEQPDSAIAAHELAISVPDPGRIFWEFDRLGPAYKRLGELYEAKRSREKALEYYGRFVDLWKDADPELQPLVRDVKQRMARLVGEGGPR